MQYLPATAECTSKHRRNIGTMLEIREEVKPQYNLINLNVQCRCANNFAKAHVYVVHVVRVVHVYSIAIKR